MNNKLSEIAKVRFDSLAGYCRQPELTLFADEIQWFQTHNETILITIVHDHEDGDFAAILFARDLKERYRFIQIGPFVESRDEVLASIPEMISAAMKDFESEKIQGDEKGRPINFFTPVVAAAKLSTDFAKLLTLEGYSPALEIIKPMMRWYEDIDGNFIEQFQTTGFDTRFWELYLFAMLVEAKYTFDRSHTVPDFCVRNAFSSICIEATSVNPSRDKQGNLTPLPPIESPEELREFQRHYMPIRFAGPLTAKLEKKYWDSENVKGKPFLFAIQDFHAPGSMVWSRDALPIYLYGVYWDSHIDETGNLVIVPNKIASHQWGTKIIDSGFFSLAGAENISAVITNPSATISKFNRIGLLAGFGSKKVRMIRRGTVVDTNPNSSQPKTFEHDVNAATYSETWMEGLDVFHNPNAKEPLDPAMLPGAAHHFLSEDYQLQTFAPDWHPFGSVTQIFVSQKSK